MSKRGKILKRLKKAMTEFKNTAEELAKLSEEDAKWVMKKFDKWSGIEFKPKDDLPF